MRRDDQRQDGAGCPQRSAAQGAVIRGGCPALQMFVGFSVCRDFVAIQLAGKSARGRYLFFFFLKKKALDVCTGK